MFDKVTHARFDTLLLTAIVLTGAVLRFYNYTEVPLTHDELSALSRLKFNSFLELIEKGVKIDGHPAGVQVFLYYWTRLFGTSDAIVKLPFTLFGIASIFLAYQVVAKWFSSTSALLAAAYLATLQFAVMYSQIARPYISGLFFSLLMVLCWTRFLFGDTHQKRNLAGFVLAAAACCYNHHFSLLFAFIVSCTGLFFMSRANRLLYLGALVAIALLYVPHLPVFFYQLNVKGLEWLGKPGYSFMLEHLRYIFHHNRLVYLLAIALGLAGLFFFRNRSPKIYKFQIISFIWFVLPLLIGLIYSIHVKPVIQHSVLIFSFVYLLFLLFSFYNETPRWYKLAAVSAVLALNTYTLVYGRQHFDVFNKQPFNQFALQTQKFMSQKGPRNATIIFNEKPEYINHYFSRYNPETSFISIHNTGIGPVDFRKMVAQQSTRYLIAGNVPVDYLPIVKEFYPFLLFKDFGFGYEYYIFSKQLHGTEKPMNEVLFTELMDFSGGRPGWSNTTDPVYSDERNQFSFPLDSAQEWGPTFEIPLSEVTQTRYAFLDVGIDFKPSGPPAGLLVSEISRNGEMISWRSIPLQNYCDTAAVGSWQSAYLSLRLMDIMKRNAEIKGAVWKVYIWNDQKKNMLLDNFSVRVREGNPMVHGLLESLD